jgi:hypothetical protein
MTTTTYRRPGPEPGDRYTGQAITPELLRAEATRLDAVNAGGAASWAMAEVACLLRRAADHLPPDASTVHCRALVSTYYPVDGPERPAVLLPDTADWPIGREVIVTAEAGR